ncbi:MAG: prevent-host-death protein [Armatimonadetes bacterium CG2_30_59_28]|nr:type II toxin-antitoxin system Phd/YefM family antitoxin [Armatimonadota bacterium]OIO92645.1 MAG: prevent-host-death protein [Armatimonadetes bacterium CG2_30_59_28]PIU66826.1 MAG: type II toxin-antitoxin system prevent-host-death family antitoxin [Armatimonadetes bacterium CG07_land_8_20_14_0_80_59_28]PIX40012.1 MAG: type II toxin-antitoxin system prevent-host-death family antitoxin [Armatimonadetes bacterium CG_4_8_14_3_um_filter_58_9]
MTNVWQLQTAKNRFSELVERALTSGPQIVTRRGKEVVVVLPAEEWKRLQRPKQSLVEFFQKSPLREVEVNLERSQDTGREIEL